MLSSIRGEETNLIYTENQTKIPKQKTVFGNKVRKLVPHNQLAL